MNNWIEIARNRTLTHTGRVFKDSDNSFFYKNTRDRFGNITLEAYILDLFKFHPNIINAEPIFKDNETYLKLPFFNLILSEDDLYNGDISPSLTNIILEHSSTLISTILELSNRGISYNDPIQCAYDTNNNVLNIIDFSNASFNSNTEACIQDNLSFLCRYFRFFKLDYLSERLEFACNLLNRLNIYAKEPYLLDVFEKLLPKSKETYSKILHHYNSLGVSSNDYKAIYLSNLPMGNDANFYDLSHLFDNMTCHLIISRIVLTSTVCFELNLSPLIMFDPCDSIVEHVR